MLNFQILTGCFKWHDSALPNNPPYWPLPNTIPKTPSPLHGHGSSLCRERRPAVANRKQDDNWEGHSSCLTNCICVWPSECGNIDLFSSLHSFHVPFLNRKENLAAAHSLWKTLNSSPSRSLWMIQVLPVLAWAWKATNLEKLEQIWGFLSNLSSTEVLLLRWVGMMFARQREDTRDVAGVPGDWMERAPEGFTPQRPSARCMKCVWEQIWATVVCFHTSSS